MPLSKFKSRSRSRSRKSTGPTPADPRLYARVKAKVVREIPTHSAYRSGLIVKAYKEAFAKRHGRLAPYLGKRSASKGLTRWFREEWRNQRGQVGYAKKGDLYRPTKRITAKTPTTFGELSSKDLRRASEEKRKTGHVRRFKRS